LLPDVEALIKLIQGELTKSGTNVPEPPKPDANVTDTAGSGTKPVTIVTPTEMTTAIEQHNDGVTIKTDSPAKEMRHQLHALTN
jgi:hypothetical protein